MSNVKCKIGKNILEMTSGRAKQSEIWDSGGWGGGHRKYMYNFWNFYQWPSFMPRYGNFETLSHISQTAARRAKISSISTPGESMCATSGTLANGQVSCPNMAILRKVQYRRND